MTPCLIIDHIFWRGGSPLRGMSASAAVRRSGSLRLLTARRPVAGAQASSTLSTLATRRGAARAIRESTLGDDFVSQDMESPPKSLSRRAAAEQLTTRTLLAESPAGSTWSLQRNRYVAPAHSASTSSIIPSRDHPRNPTSRCVGSSDFGEVTAPDIEAAHSVGLSRMRDPRARGARL